MALRLRIECYIRVDNQHIQVRGMLFIPRAYFVGAVQLDICCVIWVHDIHAMSQGVCGWMELLIGKGVSWMHTLVGMYNN
jgi:hypothetical protein